MVSGFAVGNGLADLLPDRLYREHIRANHVIPRIRQSAERGSVIGVPQTSDRPIRRITGTGRGITKRSTIEMAVLPLGH